MTYRLGKWLFPNEKRSARQRKIRTLSITILGGLAASAVIVLLYVWVYYSNRF
jgi:hypothetical protein